MRVVVVGNRELSKHVLVYLIDKGWNVVGTFSAAGKAAGRQAGYTSFDDVAEAHDIDLHETADLNDEETWNNLSELKPDICICPGWHQIIDEEILDIPTWGFTGFHASDLPHGRGGAPVNWSIINGASEITLSFFRYSPGVDAGDVIHKEHVDVERRDDVDTVLDRLAIAACDALETTRADIESGSIESTAQSLSAATYRPRRQPQDGVIDWSRPATELYDWVRAQTDPYPGAYTFVNGSRLWIWSSELADRNQDGGAPGTITSVSDGEGIEVSTGEGTMWIESVQLEGRPRMWADEFAHRYGLTPSDSLGRSHAPENWIHTGIRDEQGRTDFSAATNISAGEQGTVTAIVESRTPYELEIQATFNGENVSHDQVASDGRTVVPITYTAPSRGTYSLRIEFLAGGERIDSRFLKVFVSSE